MKSTLYLLATVLCLICGACVSEDNPQNEGVTVGDALPDFSVTLSSGRNVSKSSLAGKAGMIVFFNTDCSDCRHELPAIQTVYESFKENPDVVIAAIAREESEESIEKYWTENGLTIPFSPQADRRVYNLFATVGIPRVYISDRSGKIIFTSTDTSLPSAAELTAALAAALK